MKSIAGRFCCGGKQNKNKKIKGLAAEHQMWCKVFISASNEKATGTLRPAELVGIEQRNYSKQMDGESNLLGDLSSTQTMMTLPSFHNTGDYITDRPCLTEHTLASLGVADSDCLKAAPTQHFLVLEKPVRDRWPSKTHQSTVRKTHVTEDRTRLT